MGSVRPRARRRVAPGLTRPLVRATAVAGLAAAAYAAVIRPRLVRWGATDTEVHLPFPGAEIVPGGTRSATMAVTIDAPPEQVWPWLVQMGTDRAGWYSWDRLDNFGRPSAEEINPQWQRVQVGDLLAAKPDGSQWWEVAALDPNRFLALRMSLDLRGRPFDPTGEPPLYRTDSTWGFLLVETPDGRTRLVVSGYWAMRPRWLMGLTNVILEPSHWIMQVRQFTNLQRRVREQSGQPSPAARRAWALSRAW